MRRGLDALYAFSGGMAALSLLALFLLVLIQMAARWSGSSASGLTEIAGYCMGATSFLALGYALSNNAHIRVEIVIGKMSADRYRAEIICVGLSVLIAFFLLAFAVKANYVSWILQEKSQGQDATAIWIPQLAMSFGSLVFLISLVDRLFQVLNGSNKLHQFQQKIAD